MILKPNSYDEITLGACQVENKHMVEFGVSITKRLVEGESIGVVMAEGQKQLDSIYGPDVKVIQIIPGIVSLRPGNGFCRGSLN